MAKSRRVAPFGLLILAVSLFVLSSSLLAGARYLPTRADETDIATLKEIVRGVSFEEA